MGRFEYSFAKNKGETMIVDSHCHLDMLDLTAHQGDLSSAIAAAKANGVAHMLSVCVELQRFPRMLEIANTYSDISLSVGVHPNEDELVTVEQLCELSDNPLVVAIGETGLDYFRSEGDLEWQRDRFRDHIRAAKLVNKPIIIHARDAKEDTLKIMAEENAQDVGGVLHCFTEDFDMAERAMGMGFYVSFSGIVTFKNAKDLQSVAKQMPLDRMLIETDSPYLAPMPYRGKTNEPAYVHHVASYLAELKELSYEAFAKQTTGNFFELFKGAQSI
jgi:TatD DNase family protein